MGMYASSHFYETGFNTIKTNARIIAITNSQSTTMAKATSSNTCLAWSTVCASTDFIVSANTSGYILKISTNADLISASTLQSTGVASHIVVGTSVGGSLYYVTTCTTKSLGTGDTVTMPTWNIWIKQPTS